MTLRSDIRVSLARKESNGSRGVNSDRFDRAIYHTSHAEFVMTAGNGVVYTLDGISNKVQQAPGIPGAGLPDLVQCIQDYRSGTQTIVGDQVQIAIDDGSLDNWVVSTGSSQNTQALFTLPGDSLLYKIDQIVSFSNDNYVSNQTLGVTVFAFPGVNVIAQTANGNRVVVAHAGQIGFIDAGQDPNVAVNWDVIVNQVTIAPLTQMAINDAGSLVVMAAERGDIITWVPGAATTTLIPAVDNVFVDVLTELGQANIASVVYSAFWGGFILMNATGSQLGFLSESNPTEVVGALVLGFTSPSLDSAPRGSPVSAANPAGEIVICPGFGIHELLMISPP